jgi:hypothetical protein
MTNVVLGTSEDSTTEYLLHTTQLLVYSLLSLEYLT